MHHEVYDPLCKPLDLIICLGLVQRTLCCLELLRHCLNRPEFLLTFNSDLRIHQIYDGVPIMILESFDECVEPSIESVLLIHFIFSK